MKHRMSSVETELMAASGHINIASAMLRVCLQHALSIGSTEDIRNITAHIHALETALRPVIKSKRMGIYEYLHEIRKHSGGANEAPNNDPLD